MKNNDNKPQPVTTDNQLQNNASKLRTHIETQLKLLQPFSSNNNSKALNNDQNHNRNQLQNIKNGMRCKTQTTLLPQSTDASHLPSIATQRNAASNKKYASKTEHAQHERERGQFANHGGSTNMNMSNRKKMSTRQFMIQQDNRKLVEALRQISLDRRQFRHRMKTEVSQYMKLKQHMQKFKSSSTKQLPTNNHREKRSSLIGHKNEVSSTEFRKFLNEAIQNTKKKITANPQFDTPNQIQEQFEIN